MRKQIHEAGILYIVPTPIGNLGDMVPRAVEILQTVDVIAAEDTRHSARLMHHFDIATPMVAYHDHSEQGASEKLLDKLVNGEQVALISDAGTPLIADPGYRLVRAARERGIRVVPVPGACAIVAALSASGLPTDRFAFEGFLPARASARRKLLGGLIQEERTLVFYESPHRIQESMEDICTVFGVDREAVMARELTKSFETFLCGSVGDIRKEVAENENQRRGEIVLMLKGYAKPEIEDPVGEEARRVALILREEGLTVKQTAAISARVTGASRNALYQWLLSLP